MMTVSLNLLPRKTNHERSKMKEYKLGYIPPNAGILGGIFCSCLLFQSNVPQTLQTV